MIYFIQHGDDGPIKIGYTTDDSTFHSRLSTMQTSSPVGLIPLGITDGGLDKERELHELFDAERIRGEWYYPDDTLLRHILTHARKIKKKQARESDGALFIRCYTSTKDQVKARAKQLGLNKYADLVRWGLRWIINAPLDELLKYSVEAESE